MKLSIFIFVLLTTLYAAITTYRLNDLQIRTNMAIDRIQLLGMLNNENFVIVHKPGVIFIDEHWQIEHPPAHLRMSQDDIDFIHKKFVKK